MTIYEWTAKRSGVGITVHGVDENGIAVTITNVREIVADMPFPLAMLWRGEPVTLSGEPCRIVAHHPV